MLRRSALRVAVHLRPRATLRHPFGYTFAKLKTTPIGGRTPREAGGCTAGWGIGGGGGLGECRPDVFISISKQTGSIRKVFENQPRPPPLAPGRRLITAREDERCAGNRSSSCRRSCTPGGREGRGRARDSRML